MKKNHKLYKEINGANCILIQENLYENNHYCAIINETNVINSPVKPAKVNIHSLRANYKPISEKKAKLIHPALFTYIENL